MNSKNFKKVLSTSIASLTVLSTLGGSVSTKIYATAEDGIFGFLKNECIYSLDLSSLTKEKENNLNKKILETIEKACTDFNKESTAPQDGKTIIFTAQDAKEILDSIDENSNNQKEVIAAVKEAVNKKVEEIEKKSEAENASDVTREDKKEEVEEKPETADVTLVEGGEKSGPKKTGDASGATEEGKKEEAQDKPQQPAGTNTTTPAPAVSQPNAKTTPASDESQKPKATEEVTTPAAENTQKTPAVPQQPAEGETPAIKGSIFKRAFNAIKGFFSNIFNFVCKLFYIGR